jgi:hypothetical protein
MAIYPGSAAPLGERRAHCGRFCITGTHCIPHLAWPASNEEHGSRPLVQATAGPYHPLMILGKSLGMPTFFYRCPTTAQLVQGWTADDPTKDRDDADGYETIECLALRWRSSCEAGDWPSARAAQFCAVHITAGPNAALDLRDLRKSFSKRTRFRRDQIADWACRISAA